MTRKETEYHAAVLRLRAEQERLAEHHEYMEGLGITSDEMQWVLDPQRSFPEEAENEAGEGLRNLHGLGTMLVTLRITLGLSQRELAERLHVREAQVSRDERNEYHAVTVERASRILDALGVDLRSVVEVTDVPHEFEVSDDPD